jgi:hypothetical protein
MVHGRHSKPSSHWWYLVDSSIPKSERFVAPDGTCIAELRSTGGQTVVPPSIHPSGETVVWAKNGSPATVDPETLRNSIAQLAAAVLLGKSWSKRSGNRQEMAMAVAGFLLRNGVAEEAVVKLIVVSAQLAGDEEYQKRADCVKVTAKALAAGKNVTGGPNLVTLLSDGPKVIELLSNWLRLKTTTLPQDWVPPEPFDDYTGPPFPVEAFPENTRVFIEAQATALQVPVDLIASLALGVGAAAAAGRCIVRLNKEWFEPLNLFIVTALPSGERKSPAFRVVKSPFEEREKDLLEVYKPEYETQKSERDILEEQLNVAKKKAAKTGSHDRNSEEMKEVIALSEKLAGYQLQKSPRFIADDATSESVASLLAENNGRIAIMSAEGGLFETLGGRYSSGVPNIDVYLKGYSGDSIRVDRKSRPSEFISKPALSLCLTVQPSVICDLFSKPLFRGRGLLARFLYSLPKSNVGYRSMTPALVPDDVRQTWHDKIMAILKIPEPQPNQEHAIRLSPEAEAVFQNFRERVELRLRPEGDLCGIADWANKFSGNVARLAGILHLFENAAEHEPWNLSITASILESAINIGNYYAEHALAAYGLMGAEPGTELGRRLWAVIEKDKLGKFSLRDIYQNKRRSFPMSDLTIAAAVLTKMGYVRPVGNSWATRKAGRPSSPVFEVNPLTRPQNTQNTQNSTDRCNSGDSGDSVYGPKDFAEDGSEFYC